MKQKYSGEISRKSRRNATPVEPAPMAGYTDFAFRKVLRKCGARVTWTEMISAAALFRNSEKTAEMLRRSGKTVVQLFGKNPAHFEAVIKSGTLAKFAEININMGCPARKIQSNGDGVALMKNPELARKIIETCVRVSKQPVSVKMRLGFSPGVIPSKAEGPLQIPVRLRDPSAPTARSAARVPNEMTAVDFARMCESAGASRLIVHGRFGTQGYSGKADWNAIAQVALAVKIPVIANGDIRDAAHARECITQTGAAGVMIGRTLIGAPWRISNKKVNHKRIIKYHLKHSVNILEMRKHLIAYTRDKEMKKRLAVVKSKEEAREILGL